MIRAAFRIRSGLTSCLAALLVLSTFSATADSVSVLMYHRFAEDRYPSTNVQAEDFREQLALLAQDGRTVIALPSLLERLAGGAPLPDRAVAVTIDDAYRSVHDVAWPMLADAGIPFTVFVATDPVDEGHSSLMDWDMMRAMARQGVTFANHSGSHDHLVQRRPGESDAQRLARVREDLERGARRLEEELGATGAVLEGVFAWPFGEYDVALADLVQELGWVAFGQQSGPVSGAATDARALPRFPVNEAYSDLGELRTKLDSLPLPVASIDPWNPVTGPRPELVVTLAGERAEWPRLACYVSGQGRVDPEWLAPGRFRVTPLNALGRGRQRVNCTAPGPGGRYYWFSHPWLVE